jgi:hypothetical protein
MSKLYRLTLSSPEVDQLLKVLDTQSVISQESCIALINKIKGSPPQKLSSNPKSEINTFSQDDTYQFEFQPQELEKLLKVLYLQTTIEDDQVILLIAKIHKEVHRVSVLTSKNLFVNKDLDQSLISAKEAYYQYREKRILPQFDATILETQTMDSLTTDPPSLDPPSLDLSTTLMTIVQTLQSIAQTLETIVPQLPTKPAQSLGFTTHYRREIIYCEARHGGYWHLRNEWQQLIPIHGRALTCIVQSLRSLTSDNQELKLQMNVQADKLYCLELPVKSFLTTALLAAIEQLSSQQLQLPITIEPVELPNGPELTCKVYYQGSLLNIPEFPQPLPQLIKQIQSKLQESFPGHF